MNKLKKINSPFIKSLLILFSVIILFACSQNGITNPSDGNSPHDSTGNNEDPSETSIHLVWDSSTLTKVSTATSSAGYSGYARMIQLQDGSLICVYEADGNVVAVMSDNKGVTWSDTVTIAARKPGIKMSTPDILQLDDGSLLVMYNPRPLKPYKPSKRFAIRTKKATTVDKHGQMGGCYTNADTVQEVAVGNLRRYNCQVGKFNYSFLMKPMALRQMSRKYHFCDQKMEG